MILKQWTVRSSVRDPAAAECVGPVGWGASMGRPRVLIELPDGADRWAHEDALRSAGYDVRSCGGPTARVAPVDGAGDFAAPISDATAPKACDLLVKGCCSLVSGADVVVSTTELLQGRQILAAHRDGGTSGLVVEGPPDGSLASSDVIAGAVTIEYPVTTVGLLAAVERALGRDRPGLTADA